jgi:hypothetical protein
MFSTILTAITGLFSPATKLIDKVSTTDQERLELRNELAKIEAQVQSQVIELEKRVIEAQLEVQKAELGSSHWIVAAWRPIASLSMVAIAIYHSYSGVPMPSSMNSLIELFLGVHAGGRTVEKIASSIGSMRK